MKIEQLDAALGRGLGSVYLFGGAEPLLIQECRDKVRRKATSEGFDEREILVVERGFDWEQVAQAGSEPSLFARRKIIDLRLPTGKPGLEGAKALRDFAADPDPDTLLLISCEQWDSSSRKSAWAKALDQSGVRIDIWPIGPGELPAWINGRMKAAGLVPDREAVMILADLLEGNLLAAQQEIEKLALLKGSGPISAEDVLASVANSARFDAFLLADRILSGDLEDGLRVASGLHRIGVPIQMVNGALVSSIRKLELYGLALANGEAEIMAFRQLQIWGGSQAAMRAAVHRITGKRMAQAWVLLARMDQQIKGLAPGDPWHELDRFVARLCA
jgi:DNA polymerase-3 subunit delta